MRVNLRQEMYKESKDASDLGRYTLDQVIDHIREEVLANDEDKLNLEEIRKNVPGAMARFRQRISDIIVYHRLYVTGYTIEELADEVLNHVCGLGPLEQLLKREDITITDIMVNGPNRPIMIKTLEHGMVQTELEFTSDEQIMGAIYRILDPLDIAVNNQHPYAQAKLPDGSRVMVIIPPASLIGPTITIRRFVQQAFSPHELVNMGFCSVEMMSFLSYMVLAGANILLCGSVGTGKTSTLRTLSGFIPPKDRIITIEDADELRQYIDPKRHVLAMEAVIRKDNPVTMKDLMTLSLRLQGDRILVGEVRRNEAAELLEAMRTGIYAMGTIHGSSPREAIERFGTEIRRYDGSIDAEILYDEICNTLDLVILLKDFRNDGGRKMIQICEPIRYKDGKVYINEIFKLERTVVGGQIKEEFKFVGPVSANLAQKAIDNGVVLKDKWIPSK